jgi:hypothetical protein
MAVVEGCATGFFVGVTLIEAARGSNFWTWSWTLVLAFASGIGTVQGTLVALHNCPLPNQSADQPEKLGATVTQPRRGAIR